MLEGMHILKLTKTQKDRTTKGKIYTLVRLHKSLVIIDDNGDPMKPSILNLETWELLKPSRG